MSRTLRITLAALLGIAGRPGAAPALTAREVLDQAKKLDDTVRHWTDRRQTMTLTTVRSTGEQRREIKVYDRRVDGEAQSISFFLAPSEIKGTAFLQYTHKNAQSEQWLYLPNLQRKRQITGGDRDQSFMGSVFTYRDLDIMAKYSDWTESEAPSQLLGDEPVGGVVCHKIELRPTQDGMPYGRILLWLEHERLVARKMDYFDRHGEHVKSLVIEDVRDIGPIPTPQRAEMRDVRSGARTLVELAGVEYDTGLAADLFTERYLARGDL